MAATRVLGLLQRGKTYPIILSYEWVVMGYGIGVDFPIDLGSKYLHYTIALQMYHINWNSEIVVLWLVLDVKVTVEMFEFVALTST